MRSSFVQALVFVLSLPAPWMQAAEPVVKPVIPAVQESIGVLRSLGTISISKTADWVAITPDAVWVAGAKPNVVRKIDKDTNKVVLSVALPGEPCAGLAVAFGSLWVPLCGRGGEVARVDERTGRLVASIGQGPASEGGITASRYSIWCTADDAGTLLRIDPATNRVRQRVRVAPGSHNPVVVQNQLWITSGTGNLVTAVDTASGTVIGTVGTGPQPRFLTSGGGSVWVLNQGDGSVTRIDPVSRRVVATIAAGIAGHGGDIAYGGGMVWASIFAIPLSQIDPASNRVVRQWKGAGGDSLRLGHNAIWLTDYHRGTVTRFAIPKPRSKDSRNGAGTLRQ